MKESFILFGFLWFIAVITLIYDFYRSKKIVRKRTIEQVKELDREFEYKMKREKYKNMFYNM